MRQQVLRFALVGVVNTAVYYGCYLLLRSALPYLLAHVIAFAISLVGSFFLNARFTYRVRPTLKRFLLFPLSAAANFVITTVGVVLLVEGLRVDERIAPLLAAAAAIPLTFLVARHVMVHESPLSRLRALATGGRMDALAAGLSGVIVVVSFAVRHVRPFGHRSILFYDLRQQYAPFLSYLHEVLTGHGSLLFTWRGDLGVNFWPSAAYYLLSPFNVLFAVAGQDRLPEAAALLIVLKVSLAAALAARALMSVRRGPWPLAAVLGTAYAVGPWSGIYGMNLMWLDALWLLPLLVLVIERLLRAGDRWPLAAAVGLAVICNYYTAWMLLLFAGSWFALRLWVEHSPAVRGAIGSCLAAATSVAVGLGCAAFVVLPTVLALRERPVVTGVRTFVAVPVSLPTFAARLIGGTAQWKSYSPNLSPATSVLVLVVVAAVGSALTRRERVASFALLLWLLLPLEVEPLYTMWHGFDQPDGSPYRFTFLVTFALVLIAWRVAAAGTAPSRRVLLGSGLAIAAVLGVGLQRGDLVRAPVAVLAGAAIIATLLLLLAGSPRPQLLSVGLAVVVGLDATGAAALVAQKLPTSPRTQWLSVHSAVARSVAAHEPAPDEFFRIQRIDQRQASINDGMRFGGFDTDFYSTLSSRRLHRTLYELGFTGNRDQVYIRHDDSTVLTDELLGVRYVIGRPLGGRIGLQATTARGTRVPVYRNPWALPPAFFAPDSWRGPLTGAEPFSRLERLFGRSLFTPACGTPVVRGGALESRPDGLRTRRTGTRVSLRWHCTARAPSQVYARADFGVKKGSIGINGHEPKLVLSSVHPTLLDLGMVPAGAFDVTAIAYDDLTLPSLPVRTLSAADAEAVFRQLDQRPARTRHQSAGQLDLSVDDPQGGLLLTSVPAIPGWQARLDGHPVPIVRSVGDFIGVDVPAGEHTLALRFHVPGLRPGLLVSLLCLLALGLLAALDRGHRRRRAAAFVGSPPSDESSGGHGVVSGR